MPIKENKKDNDYNVVYLQEYQCPICSKRFIPTGEWVYRKQIRTKDHRHKTITKMLYYCSYHCKQIAT